MIDWTGGESESGGGWLGASGVVSAQIAGGFSAQGAGGANAQKFGGVEAGMVGACGCGACASVVGCVVEGAELLALGGGAQKVGCVGSEWAGLEWAGSVGECSTLTRGVSIVARSV